MSSSNTWKIFGALVGVGVLMAAGGAGYFLFFRSETSAQSRDDRDEEKEKAAEEKPDGESDVDRSGGTLDIKPSRVASARAREVDYPRDFSYLDEEADCTAYGHLTDSVKEMGEILNNYMKSATQVSFEKERLYGDQWLTQIPDQIGGRLISSGPEVDYLTSVAKPLMNHLERDDTRYDFHLLVGSGMENAMALPGGHIIFTEELMENWIENEAQLATVIGHEIAHVEKRHSAALIGYCEFLGMDPNDEISQILVGVGTLPTSSKQEEEADRVGARMMHEAGYSVFQSVVMWEQVAQRYKSEAMTPADVGLPDGLPIPGGILERGLGELENLLTTHPDSELRACRLKQVAKSLYDSAPLERAYRGDTNWSRREPFGTREY